MTCGDTGIQRFPSAGEEKLRSFSFFFFLLFFLFLFSPLYRPAKIEYLYKTAVGLLHDAVDDFFRLFFSFASGPEHTPRSNLA